jgi:hypothetical protein
VVRNAGDVEVRGHVASADRKRRLAALLGSIPHVALRFQSAGEGGKPPRDLVVRQVEVQGSRSAIADRLEEYLRKQFPADAHVRASELADQAVTAAHAALSEAWALRRLAEWATPEKSDRLEPEPSRLLALMVRHHAATLRERVMRQNTLLRPALVAIAGRAPEASGVEAKDWQSASAATFEAVDRMERVTVGLFARPGSNPDESAYSLLAALAAADSGLDSLETRLAQVR